MVIHVIGTVNGQVNEGMRNVATHLAKEFEKENTVLYSGLKQIPQIVLNSRRADVTILFMPESTEGVSEGQTTAMSGENH